MNIQASKNYSRERFKKYEMEQFHTNYNTTNF